MEAILNVPQSGQMRLLLQGGKDMILADFMPGDYSIKEIQTNNASCLLLKKANFYPKDIVFRCLGIANLKSLPVSADATINLEDSVSILYADRSFKRSVLVIDCLSSSFEEMLRLVKPFI